jgi:hypothetical protein
MGSGNEDVQSNAAGALAILASRIIPIQAAIAAQPGALLVLVRLLGSSGKNVQRSASSVLTKLAIADGGSSSHQQAAIAAQRGAVP